MVMKSVVHRGLARLGRSAPILLGRIARSKIAGKESGSEWDYDSDEIGWIPMTLTVSLRRRSNRGGDQDGQAEADRVPALAVDADDG